MGYRYSVRTGLTRNRLSIRKYFAGVLAAAAIMGTSAAPALAANDYCGASANGCEHSMSNTQCSGHGAFGAFGKGNNFAGGASGDRTAYANSTLCGNPQGAAGVLGQ